MQHHLAQDVWMVADLLKLLSHPKRLLIICSLAGGEKHVSELENICDISQSQLSQFLWKLEKEGILASEKHGQFVKYRIADIRISGLLAYLEKEFCKCNI